MHPLMAWEHQLVRTLIIWLLHLQWLTVMR
jgi:hypothetical protein